MDEGAWQATVQGVTKELDTTLQLNNNESHPLEYTEQPHPQAEEPRSSDSVRIQCMIEVLCWVE